MKKNNEKFSFPQELESQFVETNDLVFRDGSIITAKEIWRFMNEEAPKRFPYVFDNSPYYFSISRISEDVNFFSSIKRNYLCLTLPDRLIKARNNGMPIVFAHSHSTLEPYHAAGVMPVSLTFAMHWIRNMKEGMNRGEFNSESQSYLEVGKKWISVEACPSLLAAQTAIQNGAIPIDYIAPFLCSRCSDMPYLAEAHRHGKRSFPTYLVDFPVNDQQGKEWGVNYLSKMLKGATNELGRLSKKDISDEDLKKEIKLENQRRKLLRDYMELWWSAPVPPTNSFDHITIAPFSNDFPDPVAVTNLLKEAYKEIGERIKHSIKGKGLADEPVRVYACNGAAILSVFVDEAGGVVVGTDDRSHAPPVDENGDPYENLAKALLAFPHEQPTEERAAWTAERVKKSRADGVIFMYYWGCNFQSAIARMMADIIKDETGVPSTILETSDMYRVESLEQVHNRVEAFVEVLK